MGQNQPKKLVLNRETVRNLTKSDLVGIEGGKNKPTLVTCDTDTCHCDTTDPSLPDCHICEKTCGGNCYLP